MFHPTPGVCPRSDCGVRLVLSLIGRVMSGDVVLSGGVAMLCGVCMIARRHECARIAGDLFRAPRHADQFLAAVFAGTGVALLIASAWILRVATSAGG